MDRVMGKTEEEEEEEEERGRREGVRGRSEGGGEE